MKKRAGRFQFFYASKEKDLPHPDVPVRDVTNTWHEGHKTEPHLERQLENWCPCRPKNVTTGVRRALELLENGGKHYMILTTNHPRKPHRGYAVGIIEFSPKKYRAIRKRYPTRWKGDDYLPYVGSTKLVAFTDAFPLRQRRLPGKRCGIVIAGDDMLCKILHHFEGKQDQTGKFLRNVSHLESLLRERHPDRWEKYLQRKTDIAANCKTIRRMRCQKG